MTRKEKTTRTRRPGTKRAKRTRRVARPPSFELHGANAQVERELERIVTLKTNGLARRMSLREALGLVMAYSIAQAGGEPLEDAG